MKNHKTENYLVKGFGIQFSQMVTDEDETIKGISFLAFHKRLFNLAKADCMWVDEQGKPFVFKMDEGVLFIRKTAINFNPKKLN